jgi:prepilin-type N-terminal cleavage/methylation domain-containing protein
MRSFFNKPGFSLIELLIVVALISLIASSIPLTMNFRTQIDKSNDLKRKKELSSIRSALDEYYNDNNSYPTASNICFDVSSNTPADADGVVSCICHICGKKVTNPTDEQKKMFSYIKDVPCDPNSLAATGNSDYLYNYDCESNRPPQWFRIYTKLTYEDDPGISAAGCTSGCDPRDSTGTNQNAYNYGVSSSNIKLKKDIPEP